MILWELFASFMQIGLFSIGGGYAAIPLIQHQVVDAHGWLTMEQFADVTAIAEMTPGPIAINAATFVGTQVADFPGALAATLGCEAPSFVIVLSLAYVYNRYSRLGLVQGTLAGMRPAVVAMIATAAISITILAFFGQRTLPDDPGSISWVAVLIFCVCLFVLRRWKISPIYAMAGAGAIGVLLYSLFPSGAS